MARIDAKTVLKEADLVLSYFGHVESVKDAVASFPGRDASKAEQTLKGAIFARDRSVLKHNANSEQQESGR